MSLDDRAADELWPRASAWLRAGPGLRAVDLAFLGIPASRTSLSPTNAQSTPPAIPAALAHYSTWSSAHDADLEAFAPLDATADGPDGRTVRLAAMTVLEAAAGLARRLR